MNSAAKQASAKQATLTRANIPKQVAQPKATISNKTRQTYSKSDSTSLSPHQQQQTPAMLPILNAPTSLTNLAQLSGITFLPMSNDSAQSHQSSVTCNLTHSISLQPNPNFVITPNNLKQPQKPFVNRVSHAIRTTNINQQHVYDLASIPSINLINQTAAEPLSWRTNSNSDIKIPISTQVKLQSTNKLNSRGTCGKGKTQGNINTSSNFNASTSSTTTITNHKSDDVPVIQMDEGIPSFSFTDSDLMPSQSGESYDDVISPPSLDSAEEQLVDINGDMNNVSLLKLMAILNNPALTITAVSSKNTHSSQGYSADIEQQQSTSSMNFIDNQPLCNSTPRTNDYLYPSPKQNHVESTKKRLPQSAANIKLIHGGHIDDISPNSKRIHTSTTGPQNSNNIYLNDASFNLQSTNESKQSDTQLSWMTAGTSHNDDALARKCGQTQSVSWSKGSINNGVMEDSLSSLNNRLNDPTMLSTSVRNLMMQQLPAGSKQPTVSIQLLKHIDDQSKDNTSWTTSDNPVQTSIFEPECILSVPQGIQQLNQTARRLESSKTVTTSCVKKKQSKKPLETSKARLYIPRKTPEPESSKSTEVNQFGLESITIDGSEQREVILSERHQMLDVMMAEETKSKKRNAMSEPDDIFINRSKRIMSKIDTMVERKRRRRFQRIRDRNPSWKTKKVEDMLVESDEEWSSDDNFDLDHISFTKTQLPLEEVETEEKKNFLLSVGLVSRDERNKLLVRECAKKKNLVSPLVLEGSGREVANDIKRFVNIMLKTGGTDVQLRVDSNIKRNDLPLIEGLNRNTSRMKMNFMNSLGLEKRSKRTTLYKVKSSLENSQIALPKQVDLIKVKSVTEKQQQQKVMLEPLSIVTIGKQTAINSANSQATANIAFSTSCREALTPPTKNEYMKSLGLIAS